MEEKNLEQYFNEELKNIKNAIQMVWSDDPRMYSNEEWYWLRKWLQTK